MAGGLAAAGTLRVGKRPAAHSLGTREQFETAKGRMLDQYRTLPTGPFWFMQDWMGVKPDPWPDDLPPADWRPGTGPLPLWSKQREAANLLFSQRRCSVKSANGVGKTYLAAVLALAFLYAIRGVVVTTGRSWRQVRDQLWGEIHRLHRHADRWILDTYGVAGGLGGKPNQTDIRLGSKWYAVGFSTDDPDRVRGYHGERVLLIVDEACGVPKELYHAMEGILTSTESYVLLIGNPTDPTGEFAETFRPGSGYANVTISAFDCPNVRHGRQIYPELPSLEWIAQRKRKWGESSPMYRALVLGEFPEEREDTLIPLRYIQAAQERELPEDAMIVSYGLDVARFGDDSTVMGRRQANGRFRILWSHQGKATTASTGRAIHDWTEECVGTNEKGEEVRWEAPMNVDEIGVGGGVADQLLEQGIPANGINVGEASYDVEQDNEHPEMFLNQRAQYFWRLRNVFMSDAVDIDPEDDELAEQLSRIQYDYQSNGKIKIQAKDKYKEMYGYSPDRADTMMLAWARAEFQEGGRAVGGWL